MFSLQPYDELDFATTPHSLSEPNLISFSAAAAQTTPPPDGLSRRKHMHRDIERKRREEMSNLYVSLRSLLTRTKGGRSSVSDQIEEAASYIKEVQSKIQELRARRDELKRLDMASSSSVAINEAMDGVEIIISSKTPQFELSRVLEQLLERDLHVVSSVSTRTNGGFLHKLHIQGRDMTKLDVSELRDKLVDAI